MNRRAFLRATLAAGVGVALSPLIPASKPAYDIIHVSEPAFWTELNTTTLKVIGPMMRDDLFKSSPFLAHLRNNAKMGINGGTDLNTPLLFGVKESL